MSFCCNFTTWVYFETTSCKRIQGDVAPSNENTAAWQGIARSHTLARDPITQGMSTEQHTTAGQTPQSQCSFERISPCPSVPRHPNPKTELPLPPTKRTNAGLRKTLSLERSRACVSPPWVNLRPSPSPLLPFHKFCPAERTRFKKSPRRRYRKTRKTQKPRGAGGGVCEKKEGTDKIHRLQFT